jgi:hypothetical protein
MKEIMVSLKLSPEEFNALEILSKEAEITKGEYLRLLLKGIWFGKNISEGKKGEFKLGGYGYSFHPEQMEQLFKEVADKLEKAVVINPIGNVKRVRYKNIKTRKKVA